MFTKTKMALFKQSRMPFPTGHHQRLHECMARHGLIAKQQAHGVSSAGGSAAPGCHAFRLALQESGDLYRLFGLYLSTRIDLFSPEECDELSRIPDQAPPSSFAHVQEFVERELGIEVDQVFLAVEPTPYKTCLLRDSYIAMLQNGENASLDVLRREFRFLPQEQLDALRVLGDTTLFGHWPVDVAREVFDDFARELRCRLDLLQEADAIEALALDAQGQDGLLAPKIIREFCRPGVLTVEMRSSVKLSAVIVDKKCSFDATRVVPTASNRSSERLARLVCLAWLRQAFHGRVFPVQFGLDDVSFLEDDQVELLGRSFSRCSTDAKDSTWKYLLAVAGDNPDECCHSLVSLMYRDKSSETSTDLLASFRQAVSCFMSRPGERDFYTGLAARILRHLQLATHAGYRPLPSLLAFYRGLFCALAITRALQPVGDPLLEAVEGLWVLGIFGSTRQMVRMDALADISSKFAAAMLEFPMKLDAMLSQAVRAKSGSFERTAAPVRVNDPSYSIAIVLLLTSMLLLVRNGPIHFAPEWIEGVSFVVCCTIGLLVLRMAARS